MKTALFLILCLGVGNVLATDSELAAASDQATGYLKACQGSSKADALNSQKTCVKETKCVGGEIKLGDKKLTDESCSGTLSSAQKYNSCVAFAEQSVGGSANNHCAQEIRAIDQEGSERGDVKFSSGFESIVSDAVHPSPEDCMKFVDELDASSVTQFIDYEVTSFTMQPDNTLLTANSCQKIYPRGSNGGKFYLRDFSQYTADLEVKKKICRAFVDRNFDDNCRENLRKMVSLKDTNQAGEGKDEVKSCFEGGGDETKSIKRLVSSCMALSIGRRKVDENDEDETDTYTVDASQQGFAKGGFGCFKNGSMALDYISCKQAAFGFNAGYLIGDVASEIGGEVYGMIKSNEINQDQINQSGKTGVEGQTASLDAVRERHKLERNKQRNKMMVQGMKGTAMVGLLMAYTTPKSVRTSWCERGNENNEVKMPKAVSCILSAMVDDSQEDNSGNIIDGVRMVDYLFPNQQVKSNLAKNSVQSLSKALVAGIIADMKDKQAKMVGSVKDAFVGANYNQPVTGIDTDGLPKFCDENPTAPSCRDYNGSDNPNGGGIQFDFGNNGSSSPNTVGYNNDAVDLGNEAEVDKEEIADTELDDLSNIMNNSSGDKGSSDFNRVAAGKISTSKRSGGGGGGGGAAGGGGGAAGGGGGDGGGPSGPANAGALGGKTNTKYASGSASKYTSGSGSSKSSKTRNPFSGLSGRKRSRSIASNRETKVLAKNIRLFSAISKRYSKVNKSGRLEVVKSKE